MRPAFSAASFFARATELALVGAGCALAQRAVADSGGGGRSGCSDYVLVAGFDDESAAPCHLSDTTEIYTDRAAFLRALAAGHIENSFDDVAAGASGGLNYSASGFEYLVYTPFGSHGALYNGPGFVSTERAGDRLVVFFTGDAVTAVGGYFWPSDFLLHPIDGRIDLALDEGTQESILGGAPGAFRGFISQSPIFSLTIDAPDGATNPGESPDRWPAMDDLIVGDGQ